MNIYKPIIGTLEEIANIHSSIDLYKQEGITIENKLISKLEEIDFNAEDVEFEKCIFKDCKINGSFEKAVFHDVIFENCDLSNCLFREGSFIRVEIRNSKFVGCDFSDSRVYHLTGKEVIFRYANFSSASLEEVLFKKCDLSNSSFTECKLKNTYFELSKLEQTQFFKTRLKGIDISTCEIGGIITTFEDIKGMIVNNFQAIELSKLLGIIIK